MPLPITSIYGGLMALLIVVLGFRVAMNRMSASIGLGDGGDKGLLQRMRMHGNAVETVPMSTLLLALLELGGLGAMWLHVLGATLLVGRLAHAYGLSQSMGRSPGRLLGMVSTWTTQSIMAVLLIVRAVLG